jgi:UDP-N-acetyl-D-mannosaminuronate dehydrogenase
MLSAGSGHEPDEFSLVFSPERVFTGRMFADLRRYPKLVGGIDTPAAKAGIAFYESAPEFDVRPELPRPNAVLGASYCGGVKETAFSGVFPTMAAVAADGAIATVHDPMYSDADLAELGLTPHHLGEPADAAIVQADHLEYRALSSAKLVAHTIVDGLRVLNPAGFPDAVVASIGAGVPSRQ